jgi:hypothetical protein
VTRTSPCPPSSAAWTAASSIRRGMTPGPPPSAGELRRLRPSSVEAWRPTRPPFAGEMRRSDLSTSSE